MKSREELLAELAGVLRTCGQLVQELQGHQTGRLGARLLEEEFNRGHAAAVALLELERKAIVKAVFTPLPRDGARGDARPPDGPDV